MMEINNIHREIVKLGNIEIFLRDTKTEGQAILCLHGRWGRGETWVDFMQHYGDNYRVLAPDQRGHGLSSKPVGRYTAEEMTSDLVQLIDSLNLKSVILVGHSMGGYNAGYLASTYPHLVKALAILDKSANGPEKPCNLPLDKIEISDPVTKDWPVPFKSLQHAREYIKSVMESELSYEYFMNSLVETVNGYEMMFSSQAMAANIAYYENWYHLLPAIKCPVLLVRSGSHEAVPDKDFQRMQSLLVHCTAREVSSPDHNVYLSNKEEFYQYFDEFLGLL